ncbi:hypothetical protein QBC40DRAFT_229139 [Triangularia verruculosa]|uniref:Uncharacterized protein n=1 Tax=Triangularia verruculosa TaxID=2587418 RepID=A0AAN6XE85_9PEZI|nr:hypothetical protein QBC40DRAFT_229139 [Triangularia verruculosa]
MIALVSALCEGKQVDVFPDSGISDWQTTLEHLKGIRKRQDTRAQTENGSLSGSEQDEEGPELQQPPGQSLKETEGVGDSEHTSTLGNYLQILEDDVNTQKDGYSDNADLLPNQSLPSATLILDFLDGRIPPHNGENQNDWVSHRYKQNANRCFSPLQKAQIRSFEKHMKEATRGRVLFYTDEGRFGLGPKSTMCPEKDLRDQIWMLEGAKVPFVLRETENPGRYRVIGEAYVHGVMYGELIGELVGPLNGIALV